MEYVDYALRAVAYFGQYALAAAAGAYLEYKYGSKFASRIAALEASFHGKAAKVEAEAKAEVAEVKAKI